jgi:DNA-directed RNA polymerase subunit RPC12/RpoP
MQPLEDVAEPATAECVAEHADYWSALGTLTRAQKRWSAFELELRKNMAAKGEKPVEGLVGEIRSGRWEQRQQRNMRNLLRDRARLAMWKREGYTFDAEHRLVAPVAFTGRRGVSREQRPQTHRGGRTGNASRDNPRLGDDDPSPRRPKPLAERVYVCETCGEDFVPTRADARYHTDACRQKAYRSRQRDQDAVCPSCGHVCSRLDEFTGWCQSCTRERLTVAA